MHTKIISLFIVIFCLTILAGCTTPNLDNPTKINPEVFFKEYCDIYVNKYQNRDLESYGIEVSEDMGVGYYAIIDECVEGMLKIDQSAQDMCEQYSESNNVDCDEVALNRQEVFRKKMTKDGCIENGKYNRCIVFDTSQASWADSTATQISDANKKHTECLEKVEYACGELPKTW